MKKESAKKVKLVPLHDKVLVKPLSEDEAMSPSGIIIPDTVGKEKTDRGTVVAVGPGRFDEDGEKRIPLDVKEGDVVIFQWGDKIAFDDEEYFLVSESNISAIIK